jgi:hypothetical protein
MRFNIGVALAALAGMIATSAQAAIVYSTAGSIYSQNFDSLPNTPTNTSLGATPAGWVDDSASPGANQFSIPGFYLYHPVTQGEGGANGNQRVRIGAGTSNTGAFMSWGTAASTERALGALASNTLAPAANPGSPGPPPVPATPAGAVYYGARFTNNTADVLNQFTLSYTGEQWRDGGTPTTGSVAQAVTFDYKVAAANLQDIGFTSEPLLGFVSPSFGATTQDTSTNIATNMNDRDGNIAANRVIVGPVTVTGLNWGPGQDLWIRWNDINDAGNDHGLGIDDLSFSATIPEPASLALAGIALLGIVAGRRRA